MSNTLIPEFQDSQTKLFNIYRSFINIQSLLSEIESDAVSLMNANAPGVDIVAYKSDRKEKELKIYLEKVQNTINDLQANVGSCINIISQV